jgi:hypothetical protein
MNDRDSMHPDEERAAKSVRALPNVDADAAFRERLRREFVSGEIERTAVPVRRRRSSRGSRWWPWALPALVAAAVAVMILNRPPALTLIAVNGSGMARIDETEVSLADRDALQRALRPGATVELPDSAGIDLLSDHVVLMEATPGTRFTIPAAPGRLLHRSSTCTLIAGEVRIKTGDRFHGATLRVYTPEGLAEITSTMLSVQCDNGGTCVCVLEGTVHVGVDEADLKAVEPGYRRVMLRNGTKEIIPIQETHRNGVLDFNRRVGDRIQRR